MYAEIPEFGKRVLDVEHNIYIHGMACKHPRLNILLITHQIPEKSRKI